MIRRKPLNSRKLISTATLFGSMSVRVCKIGKIEAFWIATAYAELKKFSFSVCMNFATFLANQLRRWDTQAHFD